jgi:hypothetical protein
MTGRYEVEVGCWESLGEPLPEAEGDNGVAQGAGVQDADRVGFHEGSLLAVFGGLERAGNHRSLVEEGVESVREGVGRVR